jgi:SAM-dependent methyltransferase
MLDAASNQFPQWDFFAHDLDRRYADRLRRIAGFRDFFDGPIDTIARRFDVITLVHSLEHFTSPRDMLVSLRAKLNPGGRLFIQVSDAAVNPFDLIVADHLMHFDADTLARMVRRAGYRVEMPAKDWISKELSLVATVAASARPDRPKRSRPLRNAADVKAQVAWLDSFARQARRLSMRRGIGLFGTAISATWLAGCLGDRVAFFVDEDPGRIGRRHLGHQIHAPAQVPSEAIVYLSLFPPIAGAIRQRLASTGIDFRLPPALPMSRRQSRSKRHSSRGGGTRSRTR